MTFPTPHVADSTRIYAAPSPTSETNVGPRPGATPDDASSSAMHDVALSHGQACASDDDHDAPPRSARRGDEHAAMLLGAASASEFRLNGLAGKELAGVKGAIGKEGKSYEEFSATVEITTAKLGRILARAPKRRIVDTRRVITWRSMGRPDSWLWAAQSPREPPLDRLTDGEPPRARDDTRLRSATRPGACKVCFSSAHGGAPSACTLDKQPMCHCTHQGGGLSPIIHRPCCITTAPRNPFAADAGSSAAIALDLEPPLSTTHSHVLGLCMRLGVD